MSRSASMMKSVISTSVPVVGVAPFHWDRSRGGPATTVTGVRRSLNSSARPQVTSLVTLPAPALAEPASGVCREVIAKLPASLAGSARRPVTGPEQNAAYGDPPVTVACGVAPVAVAATEDVIQLNGVCWVNRPAPSGGTWFTVDRAVPVGVSVPGPTAGSAQRVIGLTGSIKANDPVAAHFPSGCAG